MRKDFTNKSTLLDNKINSNFKSNTNKYISIASGLVFAILSSDTDSSSGNNKVDDLSQTTVSYYNERLKHVLDGLINQYDFSLFMEKTIDYSDVVLANESIIVAKKVEEIESRSDPEEMFEKALDIEPNIIKSLMNINLESFGFSETIEKGLTDLILGLMAKESSFNQNSKSNANALGLFQITTSSYNLFKNKYGKDERFSNIFSGGMSSLLTDIDKQLIFYFLHAYEVQNTFVKSSSGELEIIKEKYFNGDQESFEKNFLLYVLLNAYNAGGQVFNKSMFGDFIVYLENKNIKQEEIEDPLYIFNRLTVFLRYKKGNNYGIQAQQYALSIIGWNEVFNKNNM